MATALKQIEVKLPAKVTQKKRGRNEWEPLQAMKRGGGTMAIETPEEAWERTKNWVRHCASIGMQHEVIGNLIQPPCNPATLKKHFAFELEHGKAHQTALIAGKLVQQAMAGDGQQQRFWLECQAGWRRSSDINIGGTIIFRAVRGDEEGE